MIEYNSASNELVYQTKEIPQNSGNFVEQIKIDNYDGNGLYFLEIKCPKDRTFISSELIIKDTNIGEVILSNQILVEVGKVFIQLVKRNNSGEIIGKSKLSRCPAYIVTKSINAVENLDRNKVGDCISFMYEKTNELSNITADLNQKVINGDFNGKDGTIINISNKEVKTLTFTEDPQKQLDKKQDKNYWKSTNNIIENIIEPVFDTSIKTCVAPEDGYISVICMFTDTKPHMMTITPNGIERGNKAYAGSPSSDGWEGATIRVYKGEKYKISINDYAYISFFGCFFSYARGVISDGI